MAYRHGFCPTHRIAYNRDLEGSCPQCALQHMSPPEQLDFDAERNQPVNAAGALLDARSLKPVK